MFNLMLQLLALVVTISTISVSILCCARRFCGRCFCLPPFVSLLSLLAPFRLAVFGNRAVGVDRGMHDFAYLGVFLRLPEEFLPVGEALAHETNGTCLRSATRGEYVNLLVLRVLSGP